MDDREGIKRQCDANLIDEKLFPVLLNAKGEKVRKARAEQGDKVLITFCNLGVFKVCHAVGYGGLDIPGVNPPEPLMANDMIVYMKDHREWEQCDAKEAQKQAREGRLVIAAHGHQGHGHVAVVYPDGGLVFSGRWQIDVPTVANIGKDNQIFGANFAFDTHELPPEYYCLNI